MTKQKESLLNSACMNCMHDTCIHCGWMCHTLGMHETCMQIGPFVCSFMHYKQREYSHTAGMKRCMQRNDWDIMVMRENACRMCMHVSEIYFTWLRIVFKNTEIWQAVKHFYFYNDTVNIISLIFTIITYKKDSHKETDSLKKVWLGINFIFNKVTDTV